jgi:hypothetical protein
VLILTSCGDNSSVTKHGMILQGTHSLYPFKEDSLSQEKRYWKDNKNFTEFYWEGSDKTINRTCILKSKIKFQADELSEKPQVKFRWSPYYTDNSLDSTIAYAVIICTPNYITHLDLK